VVASKVESTQHVGQLAQRPHNVDHVPVVVTLTAIALAASIAPRGLRRRHCSAVKIVSDSVIYEMWNVPFGCDTPASPTSYDDRPQRFRGCNEFTAEASLGQARGLYRGNAFLSRSGAIAIHLPGG
jgi:hypothetical protein